MIIIHEFSILDARQLGVTTTAKAALLGEMALERARASFSLFNETMVAGEADKTLTIDINSATAVKPHFVNKILALTCQKLAVGQCVPEACQIVAVSSKK